MGYLNIFMHSINENTVGIVRRSIEVDDKEWFIREFVRSYFFIYSNKSFCITEDGKEIRLGKEDVDRKKEWLRATAIREFDQYIVNPKNGYKGIVGLIKDKPIGVVLYRELKDEKTVYLAQGFVVPEQQKNGIGTHLLAQLIKNLSCNFERFEALTRTQNNAAIGLYQKLGFTHQITTLAIKYGYDPSKYNGFYLNISQPNSNPTFKKLIFSDID